MTPSKPAAKPFALAPHPNLYEISTWAWLEKLSTRTGRIVKLGNVPDKEWDALAQLGFNAIWLMGVWRRSPESRRLALADRASIPQYDRALPGWKPEDVVGSPYAVADYVPDPRIGTWAELDSVREKLHARGMALFLDFVGNHTALDHPWTREHPDFYVQGTQTDFGNDPSLFYRIETAKQPLFLAHGKDPYFPPWTDTLQLNHFSPAMRAAELATLRTIAQHCDGVRCDMAMLHLNDIFEKSWSPFLKGVVPPATEFWAEVRFAMPNLILLAEAYWGTERRLLDLGFSFCYDKELYDAVRDVAVRNVRSGLKQDPGYQNHLTRFLENHDEARFAAVFSAERRASAATLMGTAPGMRLYHQGELDGLKIRLPIALRMAADEPPDPQAAAFFAKILRVAAENAFHNGVWNLLVVTPEGDAPPDALIAYEWRSENSWKVIAVNLMNQASQGRVHFEGHSLAAKEYIFYDQMNDVRYVRAGDEIRSAGLFVRREAFQVHIFDVSPVPEP